MIGIWGRAVGLATAVWRYEGVGKLKSHVTVMNAVMLLKPCSQLDTSSQKSTFDADLPAA